MAHKIALAMRFWDGVVKGVREENGPSPNSQPAKTVELSTERRQQILTLVCDQMSVAGKGSFAAAVFFKEVQFKRCPPLGMRRQAYVGLLVEATGINEAELNKFRSTITKSEQMVIHVAEGMREEQMSEFYKRESERMRTEMAQDVAAVM